MAQVAKSLKKDLKEFKEAVMNKQPFYHRAVVLFTAERPVLGIVFESMLRGADNDKRMGQEMRREGIIKGTFVVEEIDNTPGDPADLV